MNKQESKALTILKAFFSFLFSLLGLFFKLTLAALGLLWLLVRAIMPK